MNMHGVLEPATLPDPHAGGGFGRATAWAWQRRMFLMLVVLPTLLVAAYLFGVASDQYQSEAHFLVRTSDPTPTPGLGVSQAISMATGISAAQNEAMSVADYLTSHDAVDTLRREDALVARFRRAEADPLSRLWWSAPSPETLLRRYRQQVQVHYNTETGITTLAVRSFRPTDSYHLVRKLLLLGERRVNTLNVRTYEDVVALSRRQLAEAERALQVAQGRTTSFRQAQRDPDPAASGQAQLGLVANLTAELSTTRAQLMAMGRFIDRDSPQYRALAARVAGLQAQVVGQQAKLAGPSDAIAAKLGGYEDLRLRQDFLAKRYEAAAAALEKAREQALRQQLYLVRVVEPNMPVRSLYPERWRILGTLVVALLLTYAIGWLIAAGVREHSA